MTMQMHTCRQCGVELDTFEALDHHTARTHKDEVVLHPFRRRRRASGAFIVCRR
jgi:hypothetical protein